MKRFSFFCILFFLLFISPIFSAEFTEYENSLLQEIFQKRLEARKFSTNAESLAFVKNYHNSILQESIQSKLSDEAKITFENIFVWEEFHFMWEENPNDNDAWNFLKIQYAKTVEWNKSHDAAQRNNWYSFSAYDIENLFMQKIKWTEVVKIGLEQKRFYDALVESGSPSCIAHINAALWYDFAPAIGGGSESKARKYFAAALQKAQTDYEKFFANLYFSQFEFDKGNKEKYQAYLEAAEKILPQSGYVAFVKKLNNAGYSYLEYTKNRGKVERAVNRK